MNKVKLSTAIAAIIICAASCGGQQPKTSSEATDAADTLAVVPQSETIEVEIILQKLNLDAIPAEAGYTGNLCEAYRYTDKTGDNMLILTETEVITWEDDEDFLSNKAIYAHRFLKKSNTWEEAWQFYHPVEECMNYPVAEFVRGALSVTDLDGDGVAEIWLVYISSCRGDFSPDELSIRMYEGSEQYGMTGEKRMKFADDYIGGEYTFDKKFTDRNTYPAFREHADMLWNKYVEY
ncbi:MAG: hypothetical protein FWG84_03405 [Bacteroidales bacterium]|nr:hypothetical protein [Bacteroidales bacterium]